MFSVVKNTPAYWKRLSLPVAMIALGLALVGTSQLDAQEAKAGWVLDLNGQWAVSGTTTLLAKAAPVPAGGQLVDLAPKDGDYIRIADLHGDLLKSIRCSTSGCGQCVKNGDSCTAPIEPLPQAPAQPGLIAATWEGLMDLFAGQPERYSVHRSRGLGVEECVADGVVPHDTTGSAHLGGLLKNCEAGVYTFEFLHTGSAAPNRKDLIAVQSTVTWNPKESAGNAVAALPPGLYRARFSRDMRSGSAWMLVCASPAFEEDQASFKRVSAVVDGWGQQVERDSKEAYKRAYLDYLSRSKGGLDQVR